MLICVCHAQDCPPAPVSVDVLLNDSVLLAAHQYSYMISAQIE